MLWPSEKCWTPGLVLDGTIGPIIFVVQWYSSRSPTVSTELTFPGSRGQAEGPSGLGIDPSIGPSISVSQGITKGCFCLLHQAKHGPGMLVNDGYGRVWAGMGAIWVSGVRWGWAASHGW